MKWKEPKRLYLVENMGCDDTTYGLIELNEEELYKFCNFLFNLNKGSTHGCQPTIQIYKVNWDDFVETSAADKYEDYFWFNGKKFELKSKKLYNIIYDDSIRVNLEDYGRTKSEFRRLEIQKE